MTIEDISRAQILQGRFGRRLAAHLSCGTAELPYEVSERLRAARVRALERRRVESVQVARPVVGISGGVAVLGAGDEGLSWWSRIASALPLIVLAAGLVVIHVAQNDRRARELAEVDAALLTDDLPPAAYADPGFIQFLKAGGQ